MTSVFEIDNVSVRRGGRNIVDKVSWRVGESDRWVILGPNGAGKTTLVQLASGRLYPTTGTVHVLGEQIGRTNLAELHPMVGLASSALDTKIPASEKVINVVRTAAYGMTATWRERYDEEDTDRAMALLESLGVAHLADRMFVTVSSGERKRIAIARALMPDPELLILDEPAAGLDLGGREELLVSLSELAADPYSPAMVLVTHHVEEIPSGFTHALLIKDGSIVSGGPIGEVMTGDNLSTCFDLDVELSYDGERYTARGRRSVPSCG